MTFVSFVNDDPGITSGDLVHWCDLAPPVGVASPAALVSAVDLTPPVGLVQNSDQRMTAPRISQGCVCHELIFPSTPSQKSMLE